MRLLIISAPENLARLDEIRDNLARLADPRRTTVADARALAERTPVTVLLTHSVHGNEPAGFEAAMQTGYQLLASEEPATLEILRNVVVLINPSQNPDGHERFAAWSNSIAVGTDEPAAVEQTEPWAIWGRYNHYRFDMNRDLLAQSQLESKALASVYRPLAAAGGGGSAQHDLPVLLPAGRPGPEPEPPAADLLLVRALRPEQRRGVRSVRVAVLRPGCLRLLLPRLHRHVALDAGRDRDDLRDRRRAGAQEAEGRWHLRHLRDGDRPSLRRLTRHAGVSPLSIGPSGCGISTTSTSPAWRRPRSGPCAGWSSAAATRRGRPGWPVGSPGEEIEVTRLTQPWTTPRATSYLRRRGSPAQLSRRHLRRGPGAAPGPPGHHDARAAGRRSTPASSARQRPPISATSAGARRATARATSSTT